MTKFPDLVPLPETFFTLRAERKKQMITTARRGVILRFVIIMAEFFGFFYFGSSALLLDAISSLVDIGSSLLLILCVILADRPPDRHHPFGHGRFEPIAGLQLGVLLVVFGGVMTYKQISAVLEGGHTGVINPNAWIIPLVAIVLLELAYRHLKKTAKLRNSPALLSDAVHYRLDAINSLFAMFALVIAAYVPKYSQVIDHIGAVLIAILMITVGTIAAKKNIDQLLDRVPDESFFTLVRIAAMKVKGVLATEKILIQTYGPDAHVSIDVEVDPAMSVEEAHTISQKVRHEIQIAWPCVRDVIVHIEPFFDGDH